MQPLAEKPVPQTTKQHSHSQSLLGSNNGSNKGLDKRNLGPSLTSSVKKTQKVVEKKSEVEAMKELNIMMRRYYLTYLSSAHVDDAVRAVFPGMKSTNQVYVDACSRVRRLYKQWKSTVLDAALLWIQRWMEVAREPRRSELLDLTNFREIRNEVRAEWDDSWLEQVFKFGLEAVDFEHISRVGRKFLKCKTLNKALVTSTNSL